MEPLKQERPPVRWYAMSEIIFEVKEKSSAPRRKVSVRDHPRCLAK